MDNPPDQITREPYRAWLSKLHEPSPFYDLVFDWYDEQLGTSLPSNVNRDPDKLFVRVDRPLAQTIKLEKAGDVDEGTTIGFEAYGRVDVPVALALETMLFFYGKPVGMKQGDTYPSDIIFPKTHCTIQEKWGDGDYFCSMAQTGSGLIQDVHDDYAILVRGSVAEGYIIFTSFIGPTAGQDTPSTAQFMIGMLRSLSDNSCEYRQSMRRNGQSYKFIGLEFGRKKYGFNIERFHKAGTAVKAAMVELLATGKIKEKGPG
jgi:hypothetical protein